MCYLAQCGKLQQYTFLRIAQGYSNLLFGAILHIGQSKVCYFVQCAKLQQYTFSRIAQGYSKVLFGTILQTGQSYIGVLFHAMREVTTVYFLAHSARLQKSVIWQYFAHWATLCAIWRNVESYSSILFCALYKVTAISYCLPAKQAMESTGRRGEEV